MANTKGSRRRFGAVRQLRSGRWQIRYRDPETNLYRNGEETYRTKRDAEIALTQIEADMSRGHWTDPDAGKVPLEEFADHWLKDRDLSARTRERYEGVIRLHIRPQLGARMLAELTPAKVRAWRTGLIDAGVGEATVAKAYRVLRAILNTALDDGLIQRNPCRIKGGGDENSPERPVLTIAEVYAVAGAIQPRYRMLVLLAAFASLRFGELAALRRSDIDLEKRVIRIRQAQSELATGALEIKLPKSAAGVRPVAFPEALAAEVEAHLHWFSENGPDGRVFAGPRGGLLRRSNFHHLWTAALTASKIRRVRFHDLRHFGNAMAADAGASTRELMHRMGHSTMDAALRYQHMRAERDRVIADGIDREIRKALAPKRRKPGQKGTPAEESGAEVARG
ncbi:tyrosine-type recombinase/integrase [Streptacidiphilus neutrinimicus]|uniref:tyrosine-type recombinase/integrase n=1 Tax=Streptacidiphilus neutrinimicus TaxID=105420 RepID=UPI000A00DBA3|nr:site-specific integrase [Streptacidiphilus neutrinimicus]